MADRPIERQTEIAELKARLDRLEREVLEAAPATPWQPTSFYGAYFATTGFLLGFLAAGVSLLFNLIVAPLAGKHPFELIRIYLTFPLGEQALRLTTAANQTYAISDNVIVAAGCCLYLFTGMLLGAPFFVALAWLSDKSSFPVRCIVGVALSLALWAINFYGILAWLQPALFGGAWITDGKLLPWWVAAATHVIFGMTFVIGYPLGKFQPYRSVTEKA